MLLPLREVTFKTLRHLVKPIVRYCLRHSLTIQDLLLQARVCFVELGQQELLRAGKKVTTSHLRVLTGIRRQEILRLREKGMPQTSSVSLLTRVIGAWVTQQRYTDDSGAPRVLSAYGEGSDFYELASDVSTDIGPHSILEELVRRKLVQRLADGNVQLNFSTYAPRGDIEEGFAILELDIEDIVLTVEENVLTGKVPPNHHATTEFVDIDPQSADEVREWLLQRGKELHRDIRLFLASRDLSARAVPEGKQPRLRVVFGSFARIHFEDAP